MGRFRSKYWSPWLVGAAVFAAAAGPSACAGGGASAGATQRYVDTPAWTTVEYGAPKERAYSAELTAERDIVQVLVSERSRCDVIPVKVVERVEETVEDGAVLARRSLGTQQIAGEPTETVSCSETLARDAEVSLKIGDDVFVLGTTGRDGKVVVDLSERLRQSLYGDTVPTEGQVLVRGSKDISAATAGSIALDSLRKHEQRVAELLAELTSILDKGEAIAPTDIQRSYTLYSQLEQLSPNDARVAGASARFWELFYGRKRREATATLARNMEALAKARDLLKSAGAAAIPVFAQAAIHAGNVDARATNWASWEVLGGLARQPAVCAQPFAWPNVASYGFDSSTMLALHYLRYAYADRAAKDVQAVCRRLK